MSFANDISEKAAFVGHYHLLTRATTDVEEPTPGYVLKELTGAASSSPAMANSFQNFLLSRLDKTSCCVKLKCLKILLHIVMGGSREFRITLRKRDAPLKMASNFRGPPDPLRGTVPYDMVRDAANELLMALFDPDAVARDESGIDVPQAQQFAMGGMGNFNSQSGGRYEGFGYNAVVREETIEDKVAGFIERVANPVNERNELIANTLQSPAGFYQPVPMNSGGFGNFPQQMNVPQVPVPPQQHIPGKAGGGWDAPVEGMQGCENSYHVPSPNMEEVTMAPAQAERTEAIQDCLEKQIVDAFCAENQTMPVTRAELEETCQKCAALNCAVVFRCIHSRLQSEHTVVLTRALLIIEWYLRTDHSKLQLMAEILSPTLEVLKRMDDDVVSVKATKILLILEIIARGMAR